MVLTSLPEEPTALSVYLRGRTGIQSECRVQVYKQSETSLSSTGPMETYGDFLNVFTVATFPESRPGHVLPQPSYFVQRLYFGNHA